MHTIVQINSFDSGSTGNIAKQINKVAENEGFTTFFLFGRFWKGKHICKQNEKVISNKLNCYFHVLIARLFDALGLGSYFSTLRLIYYLKSINPDIIHLHNIHGYYLHYPLFFKYVKRNKIPVVWTLHDCWTFTGHCSHFDLIGCSKWKNVCCKCPQKKEYPKSLFMDRSYSNFSLKKKYFTSLGDKLILIPVSKWLEDLLKESFFRQSRICCIHNGVDLDVFKPQNNNEFIARYKIQSKKIVLGVASPWSGRKGFYDFLKIREKLPTDYLIIMVGLSVKQIKSLPEGILGLERTQNVHELAQLYSISNVFVNTTYEDNFPTVNMEAMACGTPVITYKTGGSPEAVDLKTGYIVNQGNLEGIIEAIHFFEKKDREYLRILCRKRAEQYFDKRVCFQKYIDVYNDILKCK